MKKILYVVIPLSGLLTCCTPIIYTSTYAPQPVYNNQQQDVYNQPQTDQVFYDELSPYGQWIDYPDYGYVWQPNVDSDYRPYATNGYWVYSDEGWTWVSNYSWGWATFHYGRWFYDGNYGWLWTPGQQWAPAWVTWGQSGDYYGWAPVPPGAIFNGNWRPRNNDWNFVDARHITQTNVNLYVVHNNITVINNTTIINNINVNAAQGNINNRNTNPVVYNRGPRAADIENITNTRIQQVKINAGARPGQSYSNNQLTVYRPAISKANTANGGAPAPQRVVSYRQGGTQAPAPNQGQRNGFGQGNTLNHGQPQNQPARQNQGSSNGQANPNVNPPQNQSLPRRGFDPGKTLAPVHQQEQSDTRPANNGQGNIPRTNPQPPTNQPGVGAGNTLNNNQQPNQQPASRPGFGQGNMPNGNQQPRGVSGGYNQNGNNPQNPQPQRPVNNPATNQPQNIGQGNSNNPNNLPRIKPAEVMAPRPVQPQLKPLPNQNQPNNVNKRPSQKDVPPPPPVKPQNQ
jgi:hypothetical protein